MATSAPASANASAIDRPILTLPPVINARRPDIEKRLAIFEAESAMLFSQLRNIHCAFDPADSNSQVIMITLSFVTATPINVPAKADISSVGVMLSFSDDRISDEKTGRARRWKYRDLPARNCVAVGATYSRHLERWASREC